MDDLLQVAPVTPRTIRAWVSSGLLPRPTRMGKGRGRGSKATYPPETLERARAVYQTRQESKTKSLLRLVKIMGTSQIWEGFDEEGRPTLVYKPKSFQE